MTSKSRMETRARIPTTVPAIAPAPKPDDAWWVEVAELPEPMGEVHPVALVEQIEVRFCGAPSFHIHGLTEKFLRS